MSETRWNFDTPPLWEEKTSFPIFRKQAYCSPGQCRICFTIPEKRHFPTIALFAFFIFSTSPPVSENVPEILPSLFAMAGNLFPDGASRIP